MKLSLLALAVLAHASPIEVEKRQTGITSNELVFGACRDVTFIFARGSTEIGNMVRREAKIAEVHLTSRRDPSWDHQPQML